MEKQLNYLVDQVGIIKNELLAEGIKDEDIFISMPEYLLGLMKSTYGNIENSNSVYLFGSKIQYAYENKITVFSKDILRGRGKFKQIQLNSNVEV